jgi:hypothetical protein
MSEHASREEDEQQRRSRSVESLDASVQAALNERDASGLLDTIDTLWHDEVLEAVGTRLALRDFWVRRKIDLATLPMHASEVTTRARANDFISTMYEDYNAEFLEVEDDEPLETVRTFLHSVDPSKGLTFIQRMTSGERQFLSTSEALTKHASAYLECVATAFEELNQPNGFKFASEIYESANDLLDRLVIGALDVVEES